MGRITKKMVNFHPLILSYESITIVLIFVIMMYRLGGFHDMLNYLHQTPLDHYHSQYFFKTKPSKTMGIIFTIGIFQFVFVSIIISILSIIFYYIGIFHYGGIKFNDSYIYLRTILGFSTFVSNFQKINIDCCCFHLEYL